MRPSTRLTLGLVAVPLLLATPAFAAPPSRGLTVLGVFGAAAAPVQLIALLLLAAVIAAPILLALGRPSALGALAKGSPLLALAAGLYTLLASTVGVANSPAVPPLTVLAPGLAEVLFMLVLGLLATFSAVVCRELARSTAVGEAA